MSSIVLLSIGECFLRNGWGGAGLMGLGQVLLFYRWRIGGARDSALAFGVERRGVFVEYAARHAARGPRRVAPCADAGAAAAHGQLRQHRHYQRVDDAALVVVTSFQRLQRLLRMAPSLSIRAPDYLITITLRPPPRPTGVLYDTPRLWRLY